MFVGAGRHVTPPGPASGPAAAPATAGWAGGARPPGPRPQRPAPCDPTAAGGAPRRARAPPAEPGDRPRLGRGLRGGVGRGRAARTGSWDPRVASRRAGLVTQPAPCFASGQGSVLPLRLTPRRSALGRRPRRTAPPRAASRAGTGDRLAPHVADPVGFVVQLLQRPDDVVAHRVDLSWAPTLDRRSTAFCVPSPTRLPKEIDPWSTGFFSIVAIWSSISASLASRAGSGRVHLPSMAH